MQMIFIHNLQHDINTTRPNHVEDRTNHVNEKSGFFREKRDTTHEERELDQISQSKVRKRNQTLLWWQLRHYSCASPGILHTTQNRKHHNSTDVWSHTRQKTRSSTRENGRHAIFNSSARGNTPRLRVSVSKQEIKIHPYTMILKVQNSHSTVLLNEYETPHVRKHLTHSNLVQLVQISTVVSPY